MPKVLRHSGNAYVIDLANQKRGTAKTTTALNLGIGLAGKGKRPVFFFYDRPGWYIIK